MRNLLLVLVGMVLLANFGFSATIYVNATDGTACGVSGSSYQIIQDAINAASDGDTILVCNETTPYTQNFEINKSINFYGQEYGVALRPDTGNPIVIVNNDSINMTNFTIENSNSNDAIIIYANHGNIYGNVIRNSMVGVEIRGGRDGNSISGNIFSNLSAAAILLNATTGVLNNTIVSYNVLTGTSASGKAFYARTESGAINNLSFLENNASGYGFGVDDEASNNSVYGNNTISDCTYCFTATAMTHAFVSGNSINDSTNGGFVLTTCSYNTIAGNTVFNNSGSGFVILTSSLHNLLVNNTALNNTPYGFHILWDSNNNTLENSTAAYSGNTDIVLEGVYNNTVRSSTAYGSAGSAFYILGGGGNLLDRNRAYDSPNYAFAIVDTINNTLYNNSMNSSLSGAYLDNATYCNLTGNNASRNTNDGFALYDNSNFNTFESNIGEHNGHEDATYAFNGILLDHSSGNTFTGDLLYNNTDLGVYLNTSENNTFAGSTASFNDIGGFYSIDSNYNIFTGVTANGNIGYGFYLQESSGNNISSAEVYDNLGYGIILEDSGNNSISDSNIYGSLVYGIEIYNSSDNLINNTNVSEIYFLGILVAETSGGNEITGMNVSNNTGIGIGLSIEEQNTITDSIVAENGLFDILPLVCFSGAIENVTGSGNRPINYSNSSVDWQDFEASEIILCNANYSNVTNVTVHGSDEFNNNVLMVWDSANVRITGSNSSGNYMGIYIYGGNNATLVNNTAMNTSFGGIVLESSPYSTIRGSTVGSNSADDTVVFGFGEERMGIYLWDSQDVAMYDNAVTDIWNASAFRIEEESSTEGVYNNTITNASKGIEVIDATIILSGVNYFYDIPADGSDIFVNGSGYLDAMDYLQVSDFLNYSIYAVNVKAKSVNLSATDASINDTNYNISIPRTLGARVLKAPQIYGALNVTSLDSGSYANIIIPYNDTDASTGFSSPGMGAYSGSSWSRLGSASVDSVGHTVRKDGIISFGYFAPIAYTPVPTGSSSSGRNDIDMNRTFNCSSGRLEITASYSGIALDGLEITLFKDGRVQSSATTDSRGRAAFTISQEGDYKAVSETTSSYFSGELLLGTLSICTEEAADEDEGTPFEEALSALGANLTGEEEEQPPMVQQEPQGPTREDALAAIAAAQSAISAASDAGKDVTDAQAKLQQANDALAQEDYAGAMAFARDAELLAAGAQAREVGAPATGSQQPAAGTQPPAAGTNWGLIIGILALLAIAIGAYHMFAKKK